MSGLDFKEVHWMLSVINSIDVGMVVIDNNYDVESWNGFMVHHSNIDAADAKGKNLFDLFPELDKKWFMRKVESVKTIENQSFITWEQRPYIFPFKNYRPITGTVEYMYQNVTIIPLPSLTGDIEQISLTIYDVTDVATNRMALQQANDRLEILSDTDPLTKIHNRGFLEKSLHNVFANFNRNNIISSLVMLDIDHFKAINDQYGHPAGDAVLKQLASILKESIRDTDILARFGGEEFSIVLAHSTSSESLNFIERIRLAIEQAEFRYQDTTIQVTVSFGIAQTAKAFKTVNAWLEASDKALYEAKEKGRNQGIIFDN
ncbi:GGDEF domain-containing protein [Psychrobium sp. 1_MG-2023]|uniref:GGDEF domain-containing protein n=1 Tax=Psychrobium sp. 1_MG-2023 TaxID=3062624 RepID=UPI000C32C790|nr:GGDEF domain-containing protein [Psychrobium sp. 1_MG-2023]MDP2562265.1 diguanylate cyclase [Psychrobium sp. 1_MG-2023]PKF57515.1 diguanylate cyclase [Alteromonadales bacterium alter-6D02]